MGKTPQRHYQSSKQILVPCVGSFRRGDLLYFLPVYDLGN